MIYLYKIKTSIKIRGFIVIQFIKLVIFLWWTVRDSNPRPTD